MVQSSLSSTPGRMNLNKGNNVLKGAECRQDYLWEAPPCVGAERKRKFGPLQTIQMAGNVASRVFQDVCTNDPSNSYLMPVICHKD